MLYVTLLGSPLFVIDNQSVDISRRKAVALFIYLLATRRPHTRSHLCTLLWSDRETSDVRAELRRMLSALKRSPLGSYLEADRQSVALVNTEAIQVDLWQLDEILNGANWDAFIDRLDQWLPPFLEGFGIGDAPRFDDWQQLMNSRLQQRLVPVLERLAMQSQAERRYTDIQRLLNAWLVLDPDNEEVHRWLMRFYGESGQTANALDHYAQLSQRLRNRHQQEPESETKQLAERIRTGQPIETHIFAGGVLPPLPQILIGRDQTIDNLRQMLTSIDNENKTRMLVLQGWPGIGKTTISAALAHDLLIQRHFTDGILWASLGQSPDMMATLVKWGNALNLPAVQQARSINDASQILNTTLHDKRVLLIVDDIWEDAHFRPFNIGGPDCAILVTSRLNRVAQALITRKDQLYKIPVLTEDQALALLRELAPDAVESHPEEIRELVRDLEGLPLALQVIGRLLREEHILGWGVHDLLEELREGTRLLNARVPIDRQWTEEDVPTTVAALLDLSTRTLDDEIRKQFALLGVFAPKPAVFELDAIQAVWAVDEPRSTVRRLVERGLLDVVPGGAFQMHALLVQHARMMFGSPDDSLSGH